MLAIVTNAEISLKGRNRGDFEKRLMANIARAFKRKNINVVAECSSGRYIIDINTDDEELVRETLSKVFGVAKFFLVEEVAQDFTVIAEKAQAIFEQWKKEGITHIAFDTKRANKEFPFNTPAINEKLGAIALGAGLRMRYDSPQRTLFTQLTQKRAFISKKEFEGPGGLPVGISGKMLCLFSGGIDSGVSPYMLMKRGCHVDYLHLHILANEESLLQSKVPLMLSILGEYQGNAQLHSASYAYYQLQTSGNIHAKLELVMFKHFLLCLAQELCKRYGYDGIITGDSVAQVASQTVKNLRAQRHRIDMVVHSPLIGLNKQEIVDLAKYVGTYKVSLAPYKDCCSLVSSKASTAVTPKHLDDALEKIDMNNLVEKTLADLHTHKISSF